MVIIGIAGGIASGKSLVTSCFQHFGAKILDGDRVGHEVLTEPEVIAEIVDRWGSQVLSGGAIDRKQLALIVFAEGSEAASELQHLEQITHPRIGFRIKEQLDATQRAGTCPAVVLDAPVMFKVGWDQFCDHIVFVEAPLEVRRRRARERGWEDGELERREALQVSVELKRARSTDVIHNSGSKAETYRSAARLWTQWGLPTPATLDAPEALISD